MKHKIAITLAAMFTLATPLLTLPTEASAAPSTTVSKTVPPTSTTPASNFLCHIWRGYC